MLKAMKEQLLTLAKDEDGRFHLMLRRKVGKRATVMLEERVKKIITLMPDFVNRIYHHWNRSEAHSSTKQLGGYLLTYLYEPEDFISNTEWGLFGYVDDAYFVAKIYTIVIDEEMVCHGKVAGIDSGFYEDAKYLMRYVRGVIPEETKKIDEVIIGLLQGDTEPYLKAFREKANSA